MPHGELTAREGLCSQHRGDAAHAQWLACLVEALDGLLHLGLD